MLLKPKTVTDFRYIAKNVKS